MEVCTPCKRVAPVRMGGGDGQLLSVWGMAGGRKGFREKNGSERKKEGEKGVTGGRYKRERR